MRKRFVAWLLCLCMVCTLLPFAVFAEEEGTVTGAEGATAEAEAVPAEEGETAAVATQSVVTSGEFWKVEGNTLTITGEMVYSGDAPWLSLKDSIYTVVIGEGVTAIPEKAFADLSSCYKVRIPASVTSIGDNAFLNIASDTAFENRVKLFTGYTKAQCEAWDKATFEKYGLVYGKAVLAYNHYDDSKHTYDHEFTSASTCDVQGFIGNECCCGEFTIEKVLDYADHTPETIDAVAATCTEKGKTEGSKCSVCGKVLVEPTETDYAEHTPVEVAEEAPTDIADGHKAGTKCSVCGKVLSGCEVIPGAAVENSGSLDTDKGKDTAKWSLNADGVLYIYGEGTIKKEQPWSSYRPKVKKIIIAEGITGIPSKAFRKFANCAAVCIPASCTSIGDGAFTGMGSDVAEAGGLVVLFTAYSEEYVSSTFDYDEYKRIGAIAGLTVTSNHYDPEKHNWSETPTVIPATCSQEGRKERYCQCGEIDVMETYPKKEHTPETIPAVAATCTSTGLTEGSKCSECGEILVAQKEVAMAAHTIQIIPGKAATCTEKGLTDGEYCTVCKQTVKEQVEIDLLPHTPVTVEEKLPTATEDGHTAGTKCSVCGTVLTGCEVIKAATIKYEGTVLTSDGDAQWTLNENGVLTIFNGTGELKGAPWLAYESKVHIRTVVVCEGITAIAEGSFKDCDRLTTVSLPQSLTNIGAEAFYGCDRLTAAYIPNSVTTIGDSAFYKCSKLEALTLGSGLKTIGNSAFYYCKAVKSITLPAGLETIGEYAFQKCTGLTAMNIPDSVTSMGKGAFAGCTGLTSVSVGTGLKQIKEEAFSGDKYITSVTLRNTLTVVRDGAFNGCSKLATVYYYGTEAMWKETVIGQNNEPLTGAKFVYLYKETVANKVTLNLNGTSLEGKTVYIDGVAYTGEDGVKGDKVSITLPHGNAKTAVIYTWNKTGADVDVHEKYPTAMYVWVLTQEDGMYVSTRMDVLDNLLTYAGSSIRITGKKGIRMITGVSETAKKGLTSSKGYNGYTLVEYGTIVAWVDDLKGADLVLSTPGVKGGQAYSKANKKDAVYKKTNGQVQYTNVLVGFTEEQCKPDLAMRPYIILADAIGNQITLYGGTVERSIGYIAYQNRAAFKSGTTSYEYIWSIIHTVYGDKYDADYQR